MTIDIHRTPPHAAEAEQGLLGSILNLPQQIMENCMDRVQSHHFFIPANQTIYGALVRMFESRKSIDIITLSQFLEDDGQIENIGGRAYITSLLTFVPTAAAWEHYLEIVKEKFVRRQIIVSATELVRQAYEETEDTSQLLEAAQESLTAIVLQTEKPDVVKHIRPGIQQSIEELEAAYRNRGNEAVRGIATGIHDFDRMTAGLVGQQLVVIGARPSQGKTAIAMNFAAHMAVENKVPVGIFSMEMSYQEIANRLMSCHAGVSAQRFRDGFLGQEDFQRIPKLGGAIADSPMWIDDSPALSISSFRARARLMRTRYGVKVIVVDYLQLMRSTSKRAADARWLEITEISAGLKATAKELNIPIICCAQLNREAEGREFGRPKLSDLRESGSIEQDADVVCLLWRPERHIEHYNQRKKLAQKLKLLGENDLEMWSDELTPDQLKERDRMLNEYAVLILAKQRNGPCNDIELRFKADLTRFENVTAKVWSNKQEERQSA